MKRSSTLKRSGRIKPKKRSAAERGRIYGSSERIQFVKSLPCVVPICGKSPSENAHVRNGGMGRKADSRYVIPLCASHHAYLHRVGSDSFEDYFGLNLELLAERMERAWQILQGISA